MARGRSIATGGGRVVVTEEMEDPTVGNLVSRRKHCSENSPGSIANPLVRSRDTTSRRDLEELGTPQEIRVIRKALSISMGREVPQKEATSNFIIDSLLETNLLRFDRWFKSYAEFSWSPPIQLVVYAKFSCSPPIRSVVQIICRVLSVSANSIGGLCQVLLVSADLISGSNHIPCSLGLRQFNWWFMPSSLGLRRFHRWFKLYVEFSRSPPVQLVVYAKFSWSLPIQSVVQIICRVLSVSANSIGGLCQVLLVSADSIGGSNHMSSSLGLRQFNWWFMPSSLGLRRFDRWFKSYAEFSRSPPIQSVVQIICRVLSVSADLIGGFLSYVEFSRSTPI
ncbi:putative inositol polyphosphate multikinase beta [Sesbania bispinosa]|nr:putative inositol polyphosphate multikinase beta [Sesbania bispinosa]